MIYSTIPQSYHGNIFSPQAFALVTVVCAAVTIAELKGFPNPSQTDSTTYDRYLENTRTQTRVVCGFVFVTAVATIVTRALVIVITTLNFGFAKEFGIQVLIAVSRSIIPL